MLRSFIHGFLRRRTRQALSFDLLRLRVRMPVRKSHALTPDSRLLHLGCGDRIVPGFLNADVRGSEQDVDLARGALPWATGQFDHVVSQQVIEHLDLESELMPLLRDVVRVLTPSGIAWLACPDMESICRSYLADGGEALLKDRKKRWPGFSLGGLPPQHMLNVLFHQSGEHVNLFDFTLLAHILKDAGFARVERIQERAVLDAFPSFPPRDDDDVSLYVKAYKA